MKLNKIANLLDKKRKIEKQIEDIQKNVLILVNL